MTTIRDILSDLDKSGKAKKVGLWDGCEFYYARTLIDEYISAGAEEYLDREAYIKDGVIWLADKDKGCPGGELGIIPGFWDECGDFHQNEEDYWNSKG